ncbi:uncharacterized protein DNG_07641 [Cephalotrichum gorgonifer]|uniref:Vacuolar membrane protein n=1 Tax=Cephalotrichum gorgonifer TaxID=2041049 RepID=A0AAE8N211_9PEZI|nr:uncharacterized protein DNG_07641 [Cephalotrichum gorgonifer]
MGCLTHRRKAVNVGTDQNWSYINLKDFKSTSCFTPFAYGYLWLMLLTSVAVYGVDTFVAVNLLAFDSWSSQIDPGVDRDIAKWVFSVCIIASFVNLAFEHIRAWRVMRRGNVAECYLDSLAVRLESIRMGKGQGWRRFLVFASLTKSKKGAEYIALFTYFSFQSWIRVLICSGPRQVINALTLYGVYTTDLGGNQNMSIDRSLVNFWETIQKLAEENLQQVVILLGMAFTLIIWAFSALFLIMAILFYVLFLWHWIPQADGGLGGYCERKVNKALVKIVTKKVNKALAREQEERMKAEYKSERKGPGEKPSLGRQATLPTIPDLGPGLGGDKLPEMPSLSRADTFSSLPPYASRPGTPGSIELNAMDQKRPVPSRAGTTTSNPYSSRAGLMASASEMGTSSPLSPAQSMPSIDFSQYGQTSLRTNSPSVQGSFSRPNPSNPSLSHQPSNSSSSFGARYTETPSNYGAMPFPPPSRSPSARPDGYGNPGPLPQSNSFSARSATSRSNGGGPFSPVDGRGSPAPSMYSTRSGPALPRNPNPGYQPARSATGPAPYRPQQQQQQPTRNMTSDYYGGQQGSQGSGNGYDYDYDPESQRGGRY